MAKAVEFNFTHPGKLEIVASHTADGEREQSIMDEVYDQLVGDEVALPEVKRSFTFLNGKLEATLSVKTQAQLDSEEVEELESGAAPVSVSLDHYHTEITSGDTDGTEEVNVGDGTGVAVGTRKKITLVDRVGSDDVTLDDGNIAQLGVDIDSVVLDANDETIELEWNGSKWVVLSATSGVVVAVVPE